MIRIEIETGNEAFTIYRNLEIARILYEVANFFDAELPTDPTPINQELKKIYDSHGNLCGTVTEVAK